MAQQAPKYLMLYSTRDGHTKTIIDTIAKQITDETNARCDVVDIQDSSNYVLSDYEKVMIGASIRYGHFTAAFFDYIKRHVSELNSMPSAFFSVNLTARKTEKSTPATNPYTRKFLSRSPWSPQLVGVFAGALWYPRYKLFDRVFIRFIMKMTGGETDTTKEVVYTDWAAVRRFASDFVALPLTVPTRPKPEIPKRSSWITSSGIACFLVIAVASALSASPIGCKVMAAVRG